MTLFWLIATAMVAAAAALMLWPLWRSQLGADVSREAVNVAIFRERLAELEAERHRGNLDQERYRQLRAELELTLLDDVPDATHAGSVGQGSRLAGTILAVLIPLAALGYYWWAPLHTGEQPQRTLVRDWLAVQARMGPLVEQALGRTEAFPEAAMEDLPNFVRVLQVRLLADGLKDADGLHLLGLGYLQLRLPQPALEAFGRSWSLRPGAPDVAYGYAQALILANDGKLNDPAARLLRLVLKARPDHQGALLLYGFGSYNVGDYQQAVESWEALLALRDPGSDNARLLRNSIDQARQQLAHQQAGGTDPTAGPQLTVTVDVAPALKERVKAGATLFVFAKAAAGPPMPLAAVRRPAGGFPATVVLDDSTAMLPSMTLSSVEQVVVGARISESGAVADQAGDLRGQTAVIELKSGPRDVALVIDQVMD